MLFPSPFTFVQTPLNYFIIYPLCFLTAYIVTSQPKLLSLKGEEHRIQNTQTYTTHTADVKEESVEFSVPGSIWSSPVKSVQ